MSNVARVAGQAANTLSKPLNVEEVFSTYLYDGTGSAQTITNGIDLDGEGGLVWTKWRGISNNHVVNDTERGALKSIYTNGTGAEVTSGNNAVSSFLSDGFTYTDNGSGYDIASWTFRKAPKFFDVVTYTGDGTTNHTVSHSLNSEVGFLVVKSLSSGSWYAYHRGANGGTNPDQYVLFLNGTNAEANFNYFDVTTTSFTLKNANANVSGQNYVAYLFAHNDGDGDFGPDADADIIKCGSYTGAGATDVDVDLGFEPQWVLIKKSSASGDQWLMLDNMRGTVTGGNDNRLFANLSNNEAANDYLEFTSTGFKITGTSGDVATSGETYIYIAIRRGPMGIPESASEVFEIDTRGSTGDGNAPELRSPFPVDWVLYPQNKNAVGDKIRVHTRLTGNKVMYTSTTGSENALLDGSEWNYNNGFGYATNTDANDLGWMWRRAPNYFDVVAYTGNGTAGRTVSHNLGVAPEMVWLKARNQTYEWAVHHKDVGFSNILYLNLNLAEASNPYFISASSDTDFTTGYSGLTSAYSNQSGTNYIAYLFASLAGVSKVGSYTGNGSSQTIDCGFNSGARFVLIKCSNDTGDWNIFDTERGIVAGNDSRLTLNTTDPELTSYDAIDPSSSGFIVNTAISDINDSGQTYIFYAIA